MRNAHRIRRKRGFSLVEVLFGIFLASACALVIAAGMPVATRSRVKADYNNKATSFAQMQLEALRGLGYASLVPTQAYAFGLISSTTEVDDDTYSFTTVDTVSGRSVDEVLPSGEGVVTMYQETQDLRALIVTVTWVEDGQERTVTLGTKVANL